MSSQNIPLQAFPGTNSPIHPTLNKEHFKKLHCMVKVLTAAVIVNFVLILVTILSLSFTIAQVSQQSGTQAVSETEVFSGEDGLLGMPGSKGKQCDPGLKGDTGYKGERGDSGIAGLKGDTGSKGERGDYGTPGLKGDKGLMGPTGRQGSTGLPGMKGESGSSGLKGDPGPVGPMGTRGVDGSNGLKGEAGVTGEKGSIGPPGTVATVMGGAIYERWGNSSCRDGAELVYVGRTGSTASRHQGGGANYICMPDDPQYNLPFRSGEQGYSTVYGTEYEASIVGSSQYNAVCAVCHVPTKNTVLMIPAKTACPNGWTLEYYGYLMSEKFEVNNLYGRTLFVCVDIGMEVVPGSQRDLDGGHFFHVEAHCSGLACPPYNSEKELGCVVCSK